MKIITIVLLLLFSACSATQEGNIDLTTVTTMRDKFIVKVSRKNIFFPTSVTAEARVSIGGEKLFGEGPAFSVLGVATLKIVSNENTAVYSGEIAGNKATAVITTFDGETGQALLNRGDGTPPTFLELEFKPYF